MADLADMLFEASRTPDDLEATGNCYGDAGSFVLSRADWKLIHGRPTLTRPPHIEYGHAWAEKGDEVYDPATGFKGPRFMYYSLGNIDYRDSLVYSNKTLRGFLQLTEHWGPWEGPDGVPASPDRVKEWKSDGRKMPRGKKAKAPKNPFKGMEKLFKKDNS